MSTTINNNWGLNNIVNTTKYEYGYVVETADAYYYIPKDCTNDTNTIVFSHGAGGDAQNWLNYLETNPVDAIYAVPKSNLSYSNYHISEEMLRTDIATIQKSLGISNNNLFTIEHSAGGPSSIYYAAQNIKNNPNLGPQTCVFIDPANGYDHVDPEFLSDSANNEIIDILGKNHANIIGLENSSNMNRTLSYYKILGDAGCNVAVIKMTGFTGNAHVAISEYSFNQGILAYLSGNKKMEEVITAHVESIKIYDASTGTWKDGSMEDISGYVGTIISSNTHFNDQGEYHSNVNFDGHAKVANDLHNITMFSIEDLGAVSNDEKYVCTSMNEIRTNVKNTALVKGGCKNIGCQSTTIVPTCAENFLNDYFDVVLNILDKITKETQNAANISLGIIKTDEELINASEEMVGITTHELEKIVYVHTGGGSSASSIPSSSTPQDIPSKSSDTPSSGEGDIEDEQDPNSEEPKSKEPIELKPYSTDSLLNKGISERAYDITADDLNRLFKHWADRTGNYNSPLLGTGESWIKACDEVDIDPLVLVGICGEETGRGGFKGMGWMSKKNFFGMRYIDPTGDGTGRSTKWAGQYDLFDTVDEAVLASAKRIKNFYGGVHGGTTTLKLARTGYVGSGSDPNYFGNIWASIMKESLDYITGTNGGV